MEENLKIDTGYLNAFNLGYELANELNLKSSMFKDDLSGNSRREIIQAGMQQYLDEVFQGRSKKNTMSPELNRNLQVKEKKDNWKSSDLNQSL